MKLNINIWIIQNFINILNGSQNINLKIQYQFYLNGIATSFKNIINIFDYYQT